MYDLNTLPILKLSALNDTISFVPVPSENGFTANTGQQINIQRLKRTKAVASPVNLSTDTKYGDNYIKQLNLIPTLDWETIATKRAPLQQIGIQVPHNADWDLNDVGDSFGRAIAAQTSNTLVAGEELATLHVWNRDVAATTVAAPTETTILDLSALDDAKRLTIADSIYDAAQSIALLVDDFVAYSDNVVVVIHPILAKVFATLHGTQYFASPDTFVSGAGKQFQYNGLQFYVSNILNTISGGADATAFVGGAIVMSSSAFASSGYGTTEDIVPFDETHFGSRAVGHLYAALDIVVDPARIKTFGFKPITAVPVSKKVNA